MGELAAELIRNLSCPGLGEVIVRRLCRAGKEPLDANGDLVCTPPKVVLDCLECRNAPIPPALPCRIGSSEAMESCKYLLDRT